ncbi:hypothetical protein AAFF_G00049210 [Aldrovandia affinis]|uniref:Uncharacterized protein n=1 Tax=Aldrovandia affinis TaxID=143900 RepID=A0AAD7S3N3_9TELE|nr:hypothetical protein AAFF_G00049210 [Aldrovandia affinis]
MYRSLIGLNITADWFPALNCFFCSRQRSSPRQRKRDITYPKGTCSRNVEVESSVSSEECTH